MHRTEMTVTEYDGWALGRMLETSEMGLNRRLDKMGLICGSK